MTRDITVVVAEGLILGPNLWNVMYDGLLKLAKPEGAYLVAYADDVAVVIEAKDSDTAKEIFDDVIGRVRG